jgi:hypothetical protein
MALWYWRQSTAQDESRDAKLTEKMQARSAPAMVAYGLTVTLAAFDLLMSLDPRWYSTIFGVYFFAGATIACFSSVIIAVNLLHRGGHLLRGVTVEHFHDLGKFLFCFVFFWGYIAFSQYMLLWYANIPEETEWLRRHGATTVRGDMNGFTAVAVILLFGQLLIPFGGLLSRHVKRNRKALLFWAIWVLVFHWVLDGHAPAWSEGVPGRGRVGHAAGPWRSLRGHPAAPGGEAQPPAGGRPAAGRVIGIRERVGSHD